MKGIQKKEIKKEMADERKQQFEKKLVSANYSELYFRDIRKITDSQN